MESAAKVAAKSSSDERFRKLLRGQFARLVKKLKKNALTVEEFQRETNLSENAIAYLKNNDLTLEEREVIVQNIINPLIREMKILSNRQAVLSEEGKLFAQCEELLAPLIPIEERNSLPWRTLPKHLIPEMMNMTLYALLKLQRYGEACARIEHGRKKRLEIEYLTRVVEDVVQESKQQIRHIVDFAGGRGDFGLILASFFPEVKVTIADIKRESLDQVLYRAQELGLKNVYISCGDITNFNQNFELAVGLHACGALTDIILEKALEHNADFVICTCCFGKIKFMHKKPFEYPQSKQMRDVEKISTEIFLGICKTAENESFAEFSDPEDSETHEDEEQPEHQEEQEFLKHIEPSAESLLEKESEEVSLRRETYEIAREAKRFINSDRLRFCEEMSANAHRYSILEIPRECSTKNEVLVSTSI